MKGRLITQAELLLPCARVLHNITLPERPSRFSDPLRNRLGWRRWVPGKVQLLAASLLALGWAGLAFTVTYVTNRKYKPIVFDVSLATSGVVFFE
jgi:hypothetical protein